MPPARLDQIIPALVANVQARWQREVQQQQGEGSEAAPGPPGEEDMQRVFVELVQERFVERAPPCTLPPPHLRPVLAAGKQRRTPAAKPGTCWGSRQGSCILWDTGSSLSLSCLRNLVGDALHPCAHLCVFKQVLVPRHCL
jgi:hypothetical protein